MTKRREKSKQQQSQLNKQLGNDKTTPHAQQSVRARRYRIFLYELGKFMVDISKLVFAGVIIAGIMDEDINQKILFVLGSMTVVFFAAIGLTIMSINKEEK